MQFIFVTSLLLLTGCNNNKLSNHKQPKHSATKTARTGAAKTTSENFNLFFKRFNADSVFQLSRIKFPIKLTIIGCEGESDTIKFMGKKDWTFAHASTEEKVMARAKQTGKTTANTPFFIEDTGFSVYYYFGNRKGEWQLTSIRNESD